MSKINEVVEIDPAHPLWDSFDDDDWNGATCGQYIFSLKGLEVRLEPPTNCSQDLLDRIVKSISRVAKSVEVVKIGE